MAISDSIQMEVGVIGLGVTGRNVAFRLAEQGVRVAAWGWTALEARPLPEQPCGHTVRMAASLSDLVAGLRQPRVILVFSGTEAPMSLVLDELLPKLQNGDLVMDAGDSYFKDTARHKRQSAQRRVRFMGVGLGGGEKGARHGAVVMAGGCREARCQARPLLEAMSATVRGQPCLSCFETAPAAHFVKMVHAGVELALLQLLSETFDLLQRALLVSDEELCDPSGAWRFGVLKGHLLELSGQVFDPAEPPAFRLMLHQNLTAARCGSLGKWLAQTSWELAVPMPTIEAAAEIHRVSPAQRRAALIAAPFRRPIGRFKNDAENVLDELHAALHAAMVITYAQAMALLSAASKQLGFNFNLREISQTWRGCAQLRAGLLDDIAAALEATPDLPGLLCDDDISERVMSCQEYLRHSVWRAHEVGAVVPALLASLDYLDTDRGAWLPVNLIQAPRCRPESRPSES